MVMVRLVYVYLRGSVVNPNPSCGKGRYSVLLGPTIPEKSALYYRTQAVFKKPSPGTYV